MAGPLTGYWALGTAISNTGVFTEATTYTRPAVSFAGSSTYGLTQTIAQITGPTGPTAGILSYGAIFDSLTGGNCLCWFAWPQLAAGYTVVPANFPAVTVSFVLNTYLVTALSLSATGGAGSSGSVINQGGQIGTINGSPVVAGTALAVQGGNLVAQSFTNVTGQQSFPSNVNVLLQGTGMFIPTPATAITAGTTRTQAGATALTQSMNRVDTTTAAAASTNLCDGVALPTAVAGMNISVINNTANPIKVYGTGSDTINTMTSTVGVLLHPGSTGGFNAAATGGWIASAISPLRVGYTAMTNTTNATMTAAAMTSGVMISVVTMTGTLGSGQTLTLPTVTQVVAAMHMPTVGATWILRVINDSSANFAWTVTTAAGWTLTAGGTMSVAQFVTKDFLVTLTSLSAGTLQNVGMSGTFTL